MDKIHSFGSQKPEKNQLYHAHTGPEIQYRFTIMWLASQMTINPPDHLLQYLSTCAAFYM
jgi:hypothetical protein